MAERFRGEKDIPGWEIRCMLSELASAKTYIERGMRKQRNKDTVLSYIQSEIDELRKDRHKLP